MVRYIDRSDFCTLETQSITTLQAICAHLRLVQEKGTGGYFGEKVSQFDEVSQIHQSCSKSEGGSQPVLGINFKLPCHQ